MFNLERPIPLGVPMQRRRAVSCAGAAVAHLNAKTKIQDEAHFQILRHLHENPELSQRELGERVGISLGAVNYCLKALMDRGLVKAGNFRRSANKLGYAYVLTPAGIAEKSKLTGRFLIQKLGEYEALRREIDQLKREANHNGP